MNASSIPGRPCPNPAGGAVIVSQYLGRGDRESANLAASQGCFIGGAANGGTNG